MRQDNSNWRQPAGASESFSGVVKISFLNVKGFLEGGYPAAVVMPTWRLSYGGEVIYGPAVLPIQIFSDLDFPIRSSFTETIDRWRQIMAQILRGVGVLFMIYAGVAPQPEIQGQNLLPLLALAASSPWVSI